MRFFSYRGNQNPIEIGMLYNIVNWSKNFWFCSTQDCKMVSYQIGVKMHFKKKVFKMGFTVSSEQRLLLCNPCLWVVIIGFGQKKQIHTGWQKNNGYLVMMD